MESVLRQMAAASCFLFQAMGRIFVGLCQVGAWGCFDEFNRLEERMLSAVSQQVQCIQEALREHSNPNYDKSEASILSSRLLGAEGGVLLWLSATSLVRNERAFAGAPGTHRKQMRGRPLVTCTAVGPPHPRAAPALSSPSLASQESCAPRNECGVSVGTPCSQLSWPHVGPVLLHMALSVSSQSQWEQPFHTENLGGRWR